MADPAKAGVSVLRDPNLKLRVADKLDSDRFKMTTFWTHGSIDTNRYKLCLCPSMRNEFCFI